MRQRDCLSRRSRPCATPCAGKRSCAGPRDPDDAGNLQHQFMLRLLFYTAVRVSELVNIDSSSKSGVGSMRSFLIGMHTKTFGWEGRECSAF